MSTSYVWKPTEAVIDYSNIGRFMRRHRIAGYRDLIARSTTDIAWFWNAVVEDLGIEFYRPFDRLLDIEQRHTLVALVCRRAGEPGAQLP